MELYKSRNKESECINDKNSSAHLVPLSYINDFKDKRLVQKPTDVFIINNDGFMDTRYWTFLIKCFLKIVLLVSVQYYPRVLIHFGKYSYSLNLSQKHDTKNKITPKQISAISSVMYLLLQNVYYMYIAYA